MKTKNGQETHFTFHKKKEHIFLPAGIGKRRNREDDIARGPTEGLCQTKGSLQRKQNTC
eukprot:c13691_g1_i1 orf=126-302(+)